MRIDRVFPLLAVVVFLQIAFYQQAFADQLDDNISTLENILDETNRHYKDYVDLKFRSDIKVQYLQTMSDYVDLLRDLSLMQENSKAKLAALKLDWDLKVAELTGEWVSAADFSHKLLDVILVRQKFDDEIATLRSIGSDLGTLLEFWPNRCDETKVQWRFERNEPIKNFVLTNAAAVALPRESGSISFNLTDGTVNPPMGGQQSTVGIVSTLAGAGVAQLVKSGVLKSLFSAASATPVGAAVTAAIFVVWNGIDSAIEAGKQGKQWQLIREIREAQIATVQDIQENGPQIIRDVCTEYLIPDFSGKVQIAVNENQNSINQSVQDAQALKADWLELKRKYEDLIDHLEQNYFPVLADRTLEMLNELALKRHRETRASMVFLKEKVGPIVLGLRGQELQRPYLIQEYWNQLIIGDVLFSSCVDDPWQDLRAATLKKVLQ